MVAECGGKDAFIVGRGRRPGRRRGRRARGGRCRTPGQTCVGVERVYVVQDVYHQFLEKLTERVTEIRPGDDREADYGPMTLPGQTEVIERHIADALARGARPVVGGIASIRRPYVGPVILADVPEESRGGHGGDLRAHHHGRQGRQPGRGRRAGERQPVRTRQHGVRREQEGGDGRGPLAAQRHDGDQLGDLVRQRPVAAVRRVGRLRVRPDPRRRRAARVRPARSRSPGSG